MRQQRRLIERKNDPSDHNDDESGENANEMIVSPDDRMTDENASKAMNISSDPVIKDNNKTFKRFRTPKHIELNYHSSEYMNNTVKVSILTYMLKYLLYTRQYIQMPYEQLIQDISLCIHPSQLESVTNRVRRKLYSWMNNSEAIIASYTNYFNHYNHLHDRIEEICILCGSSLSCSREVYRLCFDINDEIESQPSTGMSNDIMAYSLSI